MKEKGPRVMAYTLAKTLTTQELNAISGGESGDGGECGKGICSRPSVQISGGGGIGSLDTCIDFTIDW